MHFRTWKCSSSLLHRSPSVIVRPRRVAAAAGGAGGGSPRPVDAARPTLTSRSHSAALFFRTDFQKKINRLKGENSIASKFLNYFKHSIIHIQYSRHSIQNLRQNSELGLISTNTCRSCSLAWYVANLQHNSFYGIYPRVLKK